MQNVLIFLTVNTEPAPQSCPIITFESFACRLDGFLVSALSLFDVCQFSEENEFQKVLRERLRLVLEQRTGPGGEVY